MKSLIVQEGDPVLRAIADPVAEGAFGTPELQAEVDAMIASLNAERDGVALAAPQIGISKRIFVVRFDRMEPHEEELPPDVGVFINPEIIKTSRKVVKVDEGCLSVRQVYGKTRRHERATVRARAIDGTVFERGGGNVLAQAYQHEIDHLNGILFIDHATDLVEVERRTHDE